MSNQPDRPRPVIDDPALAWITIVDWPGGRLETFDQFGANHDAHDHSGLTARYCSQLPDALRIVAIWESEHSADHFFENLPADNKTHLAPHGAPARSSFPAHRVYDARSELPA
jgi:hypothetical protein